MKRQQAAEDAIALHLASAESGTTYDYLPPGRIYGMQVTCPESDTISNGEMPSTTNPLSAKTKTSTTTTCNEDQQEITTTLSSSTSVNDVSLSEDVLVVSPASIDMLSKLFPNKKRSVLELVLKRCNHDLLKAIEHFNLNIGSNKNKVSNNNRTNCDSDNGIIDGTKDEDSINSSSAFRPVNVGKIITKQYGNSIIGSQQHTNSSGLSFIPSNKVFMQSFYPFLPLFNPQPVLPNHQVYVPRFCECEQCKHSLYASIEGRP